MVGSTGQGTGTAENATLTAASCTVTDSDGDGMPDNSDAYPTDIDRTFIQYYPSSTSSATLTFEDLWPFTADYDFNDMVIDYQIRYVLNTNNFIKDVIFDITLTNNGGSFDNGLAVQFDNLTPSDIESVSGQVLTNSVFTVDANGTEAGQSQAVIPLFDSDNTVGSQEVSITVTLVGSKTSAAVGTAPFQSVYGSKWGTRKQKYT